MLTVYELDALKSSHPVSVTVNHPDEIRSIFDTISYRKGSSIIRMMHLFLGDEVFREGVTKYLNKFKYRNALQSDLWEALTEVAHRQDALPDDLSVAKIMDSWTLQTGYPIITVTRNYSDNSAIVTQRRYTRQKSLAKSIENYCWWVPLAFTDSDAPDFSTTTARKWLRCDDKGQSIPLKIEDLPEEDDWVIFNVGQSALYRVQYDEKNWNKLIDHMTGPDFKEISTENRAQLVSDALDLAWSGEHKDYGIALRALAYLRNEREYIPWKSALVSLTFIDRMLTRTSTYGHFLVS